MLLNQLDSLIVTGAKEQKIEMYIIISVIYPVEVTEFNTTIAALHTGPVIR
jgi:hypothetical protein